MALASVVHVFVLRTFGADYPREASALQVTPQLSAFALEAMADDLKASRAWKAVQQAKEAWRARLTSPTSSTSGLHVQDRRRHTARALWRRRTSSGRCCPRHLAEVTRTGIFPNDASITRLVGAMMLEQNDEWSLTAVFCASIACKAIVRCAASRLVSASLQPGARRSGAADSDGDRRRREGTGLCRERPLRRRARRYGSHIGRPMNAGALDIAAEGEIGAQEVAFYSRVSPSSYVRSLTKNFDVEVDSATSLGVFYNL